MGKRKRHPPIVDRIRASIERRRRAGAGAETVGRYAFETGLQFRLSPDTLAGGLTADEAEVVRALQRARDAREKGRAEEARRRQEEARQARSERSKRHHGELLRARRRGELPRWLSLRGLPQAELAERFKPFLSEDEWVAFVAYQRRVRETGLPRSGARAAVGCTAAELARWMADGRLPADGMRFINAPTARWVAAWLPETLAAARGRADIWRADDREAGEARPRAVHGRVTALVNRIRRLPGIKIVTVAVGEKTRTFDVFEDGRIGHDPSHKTLLRRWLAEGMTAEGAAAVRHFLALHATAATPGGSRLVPVKQICGVHLGRGDWRGLTAKQIRKAFPGGEPNLRFTDFAMGGRVGKRR